MPQRCWSVACGSVEFVGSLDRSRTPGPAQLSLVGPRDVQPDPAHSLQRGQHPNGENTLGHETVEL